MAKALPCYLKTYRRRAGLTQLELAQLLGVCDDTVVSKLERCKRMPNIQIAIGCEVIFDQPAERIFPSMCDDIEQTIAARAHRYGLTIN